MPKERITVTLPADVVEDIDRREPNRSKFIQEAVRRELKRRLREQLRLSLENPHPDSSELAEAGLEDWVKGLPDEDASLVHPKAAKPVKWIPGRGWTRRK